MKTLLGVLVGMLVGLIAVHADEVETTGVKEAAAWMAKTDAVQIVDVRRPDEYAAGHLKGAVLVTWGGDDFDKQALAKVDKGKPMLLYCHSGRRSTAAAARLAKLGYVAVKNLDGGITAWKAAGKPVTTGE